MKKTILLLELKPRPQLSDRDFNPTLFFGGVEGGTVIEFRIRRRKRWMFMVSLDGIFHSERSL